jgi:hypothetical protein
MVILKLYEIKCVSPIRAPAHVWEKFPHVGTEKWNPRNSPADSLSSYGEEILSRENKFATVILTEC